MRRAFFSGPAMAALMGMGAKLTGAVALPQTLASPPRRHWRRPRGKHAHNRERLRHAGKPGVTREQLRAEAAARPKPERKSLADHQCARALRWLRSPKRTANPPAHIAAMIQAHKPHIQEAIRRARAQALRERAHV